MKEKQKMTPKPELMAPAGDLACALAAFDAGADAVYAGLEDYNARQRAENFSAEQLASLCTWARKHGRKVYITLNTLIADTELPELYRVLGEIDRICPHAVIVQDLGVLVLLRAHFPHLAVHASTQAGAHNSAGVDMLERLGAERVILERQVTLDELKGIRKATTVELEVFVHGALCCSLSGMCLFSSWMGGWSGNRGRCKQPCRRRFFSDQGNGFFFSTQDLYTLNSLANLTEIGINALKIEGRLRGPDYVSAAVKAYRQVLDTPPEQRQVVIKESRQILSRTGGRKWSAGFQSQGACDRVIAHERPGGAGILCGKVERIANNGFWLRPSRRLTLGDTLRVQPPSAEAGPAFEITMISDARGRKLSALRAAQRALIHCDKEVEGRSNVYLIAHKSSDYSARMAELPKVTKSLALKIQVTSAGLAAEILNIPDVLQWQADLEIPPARKASLSPEKVAREFTKITHPGWAVVPTDIRIDGDLFLQDKQLRLLRQACNAWLTEQGAFDSANLVSPGQARLEADYTAGKPDPLHAPIEQTLHTRGDQPGGDGMLRAVDIGADLSGADEVVLPCFCAENKLTSLKARIKQALAQGIRRVRVTSVYQFELLSTLTDIGALHITTSYPLPACNRHAVQALIACGANKVMLWPELEQPTLEALAGQFGSSAEVFTRGRLPILVTRARIPVTGRIAGGHGQVFFVEKHGDLSYVFPEVLLSVTAPSGCSTYRDGGDTGDNKTSDFNTQRSWA
jgi:U32 family peptidase